MRNQSGSPRFGEAGQTLIEILIAFSISMLVIGSVIVIINTALANARYGKNSNLASGYAQEGMAVVRQLRDSSWHDFHDLHPDGNYCLSDNSTVLQAAASCSANVGIFTRSISLDHDSASSDCPGGSKITVAVSWTDDKCPAGSGNSLCKVDLITCLYQNN